MRIALISDVHGNHTALQAVLAHAAGQNIDHYCFLGDYYRDLPYPNEVVDVLRGCPNATIIKGNNEGYLSDNDPDDYRACDQFSIFVWCYASLTKQNLAYLRSLPATATLDTPGGQLHLAHEQFAFLGGRDVCDQSSTYAQAVPAHVSQAAPPPNRLSAYIHHALAANDKVMEYVNALSPGVYAFGHSHIQYHCFFNNVLLINTGSCGMAEDHDIPVTAPYTIIEWRDGWQVEEHRVAYDVEKVIADTRQATLYEATPVWCNLVIEALRTSSEKHAPFFHACHTLAASRGIHQYPYPNEIWREAARQQGYL